MGQLVTVIQMREIHCYSTFFLLTSGNVCFFFIYLTSYGPLIHIIINF